MPTTIAAKNVKAGKLSDDSTAIVLDLDAQTGPATVTIPVSEGRKLLQIFLTLIARSEKALKKNANVKFPIDTEYWEIATAEDGDLVITFVPPSSAELSFKLKARNAPEMAKALAGMGKR